MGMIKEKKIPSGYKASPLGPIPNNWDFKDLNEICNIYDGTHTTPDYKEEGIPFYSVEHVTANDFSKTKYISKEVFEKENSRVKLEKGDILMTRIGDIGTSRLIDWDVAASFYVSLTLFKNKTKNNFTYINHFINSSGFKLELNKRIIHVAFPKKINLGEIGLCKVVIPPLPEQTAIANLLSTWDKAIQTTNALIEQKQNRKKWLMQMLLTGKKRLKGFEKTKWKIQPLENFVKPIVREVNKPNIPYLGIGLRSHGKGTFLKQNELPEKNSMDKFYIVRKDDLIVNITFAWEQAIAIVKPEDDGALASHRFPTYTFINDKGYSDFFRFYILQQRMKYMLTLISPGGAGRNRVMSKSDFITLEFLLPEFEEQKAIAEVLQSSDKELHVLKNKLKLLKEQKKGLMQILLTGKKRLKVN